MCVAVSQLNYPLIIHRRGVAPLRLQRYYIFLRYANFSLFFSKNCPSHAHKHTLSRFVLLSRCKGTTIFWNRRSSCYVLFQNHGLETSVIACDIGNGRLTALRQLIHIKRLTFEKEGSEKSTADLQF